MMGKSRSKKRTTVYLPPEVLTSLKKAAKEKDRSFTMQIEHVLKDWLVKNGYLKGG